ncbi:MAG TPA: polysulfide reductase NrfD [Candidatus Rubneribacter avistercoris]|nr:polysulfide reductase NrfD [Candidatus Rubneribacter avistercoris]
MLQTEWNWTVAADLLLSGAGAVLLVVASLLCLAGKREAHTRLVVRCAWTGTAAIALGVLFLLADVGQKLRALNMFASFGNFATSWMPRGAWSLALAIICGIALAAAATDALETRLRFLAPLYRWQHRNMLIGVLAVVEVLLGCFITFYTGMLVMSSSGIPFWTSPWLPTCFVLASALVGTAGAAALATVRNENESRDVVRVLAGVSLASAVLLAAALGAYLTSSLNAGEAGASAMASVVVASAEELVSGQFAPVFWVVLVGIGIAVPAVANVATIASSPSGALARRIPTIALAGALCALCGGFALRWLVLAVGLHMQVLLPGVTQLADGTMFTYLSFIA